MVDSSSILSSNDITEESHQCPHASPVGISSFVSIKLSAETDYRPWKEQMMCFLEYRDMLGFIDGTIKNPTSDGDHTKNKSKYREWRKSDMLVKGWIYGTLNRDVMDNVLGLDNAYEVWNKLKSTYDNSLKAVGAEILATTYISNTDQDKAMAEYIPLCRAIMRGDWDEAQEFFHKDESTLTAKINSVGDSALHIAVSTCKNLQFVENLLHEINPASLPALVSDNHGINPLHVAAIVGNTEAAKMLVEKNPRLLFIGDESNYLPILRAVFNYHKMTVQYLLEVCELHIDLSQNDGYQNPFEGTQGSSLLGGAISGGFLDIAYELINKYPDLAKPEDVTQSPLLHIVDNEDLYFSATRYNSYQRFLYPHVPTGNNISTNTDNIVPDIENPETYVTKCKRSCLFPVIKWIHMDIWKAVLLHVPHIKCLREDKLKHKTALMILERICEEIGTIKNATEIYNQYCGAFNLAVLNDNPEAVGTIIRFFPHAIWTMNNGSYLSQIIATNRCEMVANFLEDEMNRSNSLFPVPCDKEKNNILHLAGRLAPIEKLNVVSGAALQMQKEVQWYKKIANRVVPSERKNRNLKGQTPIMVFREEHKRLRKEGEEWMKKTSDSYTITAALIVTIVFAAAITVPGGNNQITGKAIYETKASFIIFAIADAISLFTSTTSLLLFLSILTSRYHEDDFLYKLPNRLILGLVMLFLSVTSMMVAFSATLYIMSGQGRAWILIPIAALACLPIVSYVMLQFPLLAELISVTYGRGVYNRRRRIDRKNK